MWVAHAQEIKCVFWVCVCLSATDPLLWCPCWPVCPHIAHYHYWLSCRPGRRTDMQLLHSFTHLTIIVQNGNKCCKMPPNTDILSTMNQHNWHLCQEFDSKQGTSQSRQWLCVETSGRVCQKAQWACYVTSSICGCGDVCYTQFSLSWSCMLTGSRRDRRNCTVDGCTYVNWSNAAISSLLLKEWHNKINKFHIYFGNAIFL